MKNQRKIQAMDKRCIRKQKREGTELGMTIFEKLEFKSF
jgi:hypothetical protein